MATGTTKKAVLPKKNDSVKTDGKKTASAGEPTLDMIGKGERLEKSRSTRGGKRERHAMADLMLDVIAKDGIARLRLNDLERAKRNGLVKQSFDRGHSIYTSEACIDDLITKPEDDIFVTSNGVSFTEIYEILESPEYDGKLTFEVSQVVTVYTFKTLFGNVDGERMDFITRHLTDETVRLVKVTKNRTFIFYLEDYDSYVEWEGRYCKQFLKDFGKNVRAYAEEKAASIRKHRIEMEKRKQKENEELELEQIVVQMQRKEGGFGSWS